MKDFGLKRLLKWRPRTSAGVDESLKFCISKLGDDTTCQMGHEFVKNLTFEEIAGALLMAQDRIKQLEKIIANVQTALADEVQSGL